MAAALGAIGEPAIDPLIGLLGDDDADLRGYAALAIGRIGEPAIPKLLELIKHSEGVVNRCALMTLYKMGEVGPEALADYLSE